MPNPLNGTPNDEADEAEKVEHSEVGLDDILFMKIETKGESIFLKFKGIEPILTSADQMVEMINILSLRLMVSRNG